MAYFVVGIHFGESVKNIKKVCIEDTNWFQIKRLWGKKDFYLDILDTDDMTIERLHILQILNLFTECDDLYNSTILINEGHAGSGRLGWLRCKSTTSKESTGIFERIGLPYKGIQYYVLSSCKKYVATVSLIEDYHLSIQYSNSDQCRRLHISIFSCGCSYPIVSCEDILYCDFYGEHTEKTILTGLKEKVTDDGYLYFRLYYNGEEGDKVFAKRANGEIIKRDELSLKSSAKLVCDTYEKFISCVNLEDEILKYKGKVIFSGK